MTLLKSKHSSIVGSQKVSVFSDSQKIVNYLLVLVWGLVFVDFAIWWFSGTIITNVIGYSFITISVFWLPVLHIYFYFFSLQQKELPKDIGIPTGRIAMLTTKVPKESDELLHRTLLSMKAQALPYKHDVWLMDEDPSAGLVEWCRERGIYVASRKGIASYQNETYPGRAKTKEGNIRYFLDHWGYEMYDFLIQFDADHAPEPDFAFQVMREFNDERVGYVASPSIVDGNIEESWTVKARNYWEATNHGPVQSGTDNGFAPMMYGSHYSHRVKALQSIGGIGPEIAEDHTTTLLYNAHGWKGGFARDAIAHGYGAVGITDSMLQEYQWAMVGIRAGLLVTTKYFKRLPLRIKAQFFIWELWYPAITLVSLISLFVPFFALLLADPFVKVEGEGFLYRYAWLNGLFLLYGFWLRYLRHFRPHYSLHVSFETFIFQYLQFPWIVIGWVSGLWQVIRGLPVSKQTITDKDESIKSIPFKSFVPHYCIVIITWLILILPLNPGDAGGYYFFVLLIMSSYVVSLFVGTYLSLLENLQKIQYNKLLFIRANLATIMGVVVISIISSYILGFIIDERFGLNAESMLISAIRTIMNYV